MESVPMKGTSITPTSQGSTKWGHIQVKSSKKLDRISFYGQQLLNILYWKMFKLSSQECLIANIVKKKLNLQLNYWQCRKSIILIILNPLNYKWVVRRHELFVYRGPSQRISGETRKSSEFPSTLPSTFCHSSLSSLSVCSSLWDLSTPPSINEWSAIYLYI